MGQFHHRPIQKFDPMAGVLHIQIIVLNEQVLRGQGNFVLRIQDQADLVGIILYVDVKNKQSGIFVFKIDLFYGVVVVFLKKIIPIGVLSNRRMKVADNFFMFKYAMFIVPSPVSVQPEDGFLFGYHKFFLFVFVHTLTFFIPIIWESIPGRLPLSL